MKRNTSSGSLITVGLGVLAVTQMDSYLQKFLQDVLSYQIAIPAWLAPSLAGTGLLAIMAGIVWRFYPVSILDGISPDFQCHTAKQSDLPLIHKMAQEHFGDLVTPISTMKRWHDQNNELFSILYRIKTSGFKQIREMVGYYCVIPLTDAATAALLSGELRAIQLQPQHISAPGRACRAVFIGAIVGMTNKAKGNILSILHRDLTSRYAKYSQEFITRPVTTDGLRIVQKYGFLPAPLNPVGGLDALYCISSDA